MKIPKNLNLRGLNNSLKICNFLKNIYMVKWSVKINKHDTELKKKRIKFELTINNLIYKTLFTEHNITFIETKAIEMYLKCLNN